MTRGYFEIGTYHPKTETNLGTLWRSAFQLGASGIFTIGHRWPDRQSSDTYKSYRHVPYRKYDTLQSLADHLPYDCRIVGIEIGGQFLSNFCHPERCIYLLGAEDHGLSREAISLCHHVVSIPAVRSASFNVAVAGSIVMYDRVVKTIKAKGDER